MFFSFENIFENAFSEIRIRGADNRTVGGAAASTGTVISDNAEPKRWIR